MSSWNSRKLLLTILLAAMLVVPAVLVSMPVGLSAGRYSAWLKLVTPSWNGDYCLDSTTTPACPDQTVTGFADRYNLTGQWYWVEVYYERGKPYNDIIKDSTWKFYPNATGFVKISWPDTWKNVTVVVKAKSYDGTEIGKGTLYKGIIVYMLVINASNNYLQAKTGTGWDGYNSVTVQMDGTITPGSIYRPSVAGPVNFVRISPADFSSNHNHKTAADAWVANASVIFKPFHVHTWYGVLDNLSYAQIKIYDLNHTDASSKASLLRAVVTKGDGSGNSLYDPSQTGEMYPVYKDRLDEWKDNELVPIPLQAVNIQSYAKEPYGEDFAGKWAHLNVTVRVWWESVLVNTTFYVGADLTEPQEFVPVRDPVFYPGNDFLSENGVTMQPLSYIYDWETNLDNDVELYDYLSATVFYWRCGARDDDLLVNGYDYGMEQSIGSALFDAQCIVNLRDKNGATYHTLHERGSTGEVWDGSDGNSYALSDDPHDWKGSLPAFRTYLRAPNATMWTGLIEKFSGVWIDGKEAWQLVYVSKYYSGTDDLTKNQPSKVAINDYLKTRTITDDPGPFKGIRLEVQYAGGYKNLYGGLKQTVGVYLLENPYLIALKDLVDPINTWPDPFTSPDNYPEIIYPPLIPNTLNVRLG
ncbi:MAG: hypothetical protein QW689_00410, partial [Nitrososphaerota archaeon]